MGVMRNTLGPSGEGGVAGIGGCTKMSRLAQSNGQRDILGALAIVQPMYLEVIP